MGANVLSCVNIKKRYNDISYVLNGFGCSLQSGKIIGLLGPNGCGKTTLMKLIAGILTADEGEIFIDGKPRNEKSNAYISYLPERTYFNPGMKVYELIEYFSDFYADFNVGAAEQMLAELGIDNRAALKTLSKGTKEKVQLIMVMARRARLYLLDEPIAGVDPAARDYILNTILKNRDPESTVLITTHLIHDIEPILDEFAFMGDEGKILLSGNAEEVRKERGKTLDELFKEVFGCSRNY